MDKFTQPTNRYPPEPVTDSPGQNKEGLTADDIQGISSLLANTKELDLSDNSINKLSRGFPLSLIALDLSSNRFSSLAGFENLRNIRMLRLQHNKIASTWGLQECVQLVHLDLTHNRVKVVEGLESLTQLRTLLLGKNNINTLDSIRSLSFNTALEELSLRGNKVTVAPNYRGFAKHLVASLKKLDGTALYLRDGNRCPGYGVRFECKNSVHGSDAESVMTMINSHLSVSTQGTNIPPAAAHLYFDESSSFSSDESIISASPSLVNVTRAQDVTDLPWRRPPAIIPKDLKGKKLYESTQNISQLDESRHKSKSTNKSASHHKMSKHYHHLQPPAPPPPVPAPLPPEKWDDNFIYESHGSPSKRVPGGNGARLGIKGGGSMGTGALSKAISAGATRRLPPPPPPPPPRKHNKYPLSLGVGAAAMTLTDATISVGNGVLRVPLLASPGMAERLSPKLLSPKRTSSTTPLFPGAEQYWEGHAESVEQEEQNMTQRFRDQVILQNEENVREKLRNAPPPPPLPSEQFDDQYYPEDDEDERDYSESNDESREEDGGDSGGSGSGSEDYSGSGSRDYYDEDHSPPQQDRSTANLTSQKRGTFFGLYSKSTPDSQQEDSRQATLKRSDLSASKSHAAKGPAAGQQVHKSVSPPKMTSERRGTFFGLYKKEPDENQDQNQLRGAAARRAVAAIPSSSAQTPAAPLTSQRRGTFFGLYPKQPDATSEEVQKQPPPSSSTKSNSGNKPASAELTSQRRGTFFGLYPHKFDQTSEDDEGSGERLHTVPHERHREQEQEQEQEQDHRREEEGGRAAMRKNSPEDLQNVLKQMYEKKIETLRTLKAARDQQNPGALRT